MTARTTAHSLNGSTIPASPSGSPSSPPAPKAASSPMPATAGGSTSGSSTRVMTSDAPAERARGEQVGDRRADQDDEDVGDRVRARRDGDRVAHGGVAQQVGHAVERHLGEERDDRQRQEGQRDARGQREQHREAAAPERLECAFARGGRPKPEALRARVARSSSARARMKRLRAGGVGAGPTDRADLVAHRRLRPARQPDDVEAAAGGAVVGEVREAGVGRSEPDLRDDAADVRLEADPVRGQDRGQAHATQQAGACRRRSARRGCPTARRLPPPRRL